MITNSNRDNSEPVMKHYAFISYNHKDVATAQWLQQQMESYRLPTHIHNELEDTRYLRPIFRDQTDLNTGILSDELQRHLRQSKYLVVVCSPNSAHSQWVSDEIQAFINWGRLDAIIPFIIDSRQTDNIDDCLPQALLRLKQEHPEKELLGINVQEVGRKKAFIRVVSRMLGVSFDVLWQRHLRQQRQHRLAIAATLPVLAALLYWFIMPVTLHVSISDTPGHRLPLPADAVVTVNGSHYPLTCLDTVLTISHLPGYCRGRSIDLHFNATWYESAEKSIALGYGLHSEATLPLQRDSTFGLFRGTVTDEQMNAVSGALVVIGGDTTTTDREGHFSLFLPIEQQAETQVIEITKPGQTPVYREDECPSTLLLYLMH